MKNIRPVLVAIGLAALAAGSLSAAPAAPAASSAARAFNPPAGKASVKSTTVTITVAPGVDIRAYAIEETAPKQCTVADVDNAGSLSAKENVIKWGVYFDNQKRTLSYKLTCKEKVPAAKAFHGKASFDGQLLDIKEGK